MRSASTFKAKSRGLGWLGLWAVCLSLGGCTQTNEDRLPAPSMGGKKSSTGGHAGAGIAGTNGGVLAIADGAGGATRSGGSPSARAGASNGGTSRGGSGAGGAMSVGGTGGASTGGSAAGGTSGGGTLPSRGGNGSDTGGAGRPTAGTGGAVGGAAPTTGGTAPGGRTTGGAATSGAATGGAATGGGVTAGAATGGAGGNPQQSSLEALQRDFVDLRFGMFIHFGILTYTGWWAAPNLDITQFNPTGLDPGQWADAAVSAKMKYGVLTTKHHDGFALWHSAASDFNVGHIPWQGGQGDVVRAYVDAFRSRGLLPGLYYSIWDTTQGVAAGSLSAEDLTYVKSQITELLTGYGPIPVLVIDGWSWQMGHQAIAYQEIYTLVKSLQPDCLLTDHTHMAEPWDVDIINFEEPKGAWAPASNTYPAQQGTKVNGSGGNDWFWAPNLGGLMTVSDIVTSHLADLEPKWTNFLLNCPPNRTGTMDPSIVTLLGQVGAAWSPNTARPPLPAQGPQNEHPYTPVSAVATSGTANNAIDGINDTAFHSMWQPTGSLPQSITLDLGQIRPDVGWLGCAPFAEFDYSTNAGNVTSYRVLLSTDGTNFTEVASGTWAADAKMKAITFGPATARYVRFEVRAANGSPAATELSVGALPAP